MTAELLHRSPELLTPDSSAIAIIDAYRNEFKDRTNVQPIDDEFPYLEIKNKESTYLLDTSDNEAGTFKWRGAITAVIELYLQGKEVLVVPSAGNHARGAILAAKALGMMVVVVVPETAPPAKREGLSELWKDWRNQLHVSGKTFDDSLAYAQALTERIDGALLHPYDNPTVSAGQGTTMHDMFREIDDVGQIVLPAGGCGLLGGVTNTLHELGRDDILVTAVEAPGSNSLSKSLLEGRIVEADTPNQLYGGSAVRFIGNHGLHSALRYENLSVVTADPSDIALATETYKQSRQDLMRTEEYHVPAFEPTTMVAIAALYKVSGAINMNTVVLGTGRNAPLI